MNTFVLFTLYSMLKSVFETAQQIASKSPVAVQSTKKSLLYSRDHSVQEGLNHIVGEKQYRHTI